MTTLSRVKGELVRRLLCGTRHETSDILRSRVQRGVFRLVPPKNTRDRSVSVEVVAELAAGLEHRLAVAVAVRSRSLLFSAGLFTQLLYLASSKVSLGCALFLHRFFRVTFVCLITDVETN